jgi:DNA-binding NtrC family response regulator
MMSYMTKGNQQGSAVLIADDEEGVVREISSTLEKAGFTVLTARNQSDVLNLCSKAGNPIQLAIVDMAMPNTNGRELAERLYECYPGIRILFTAGDETGDAQSARVSGRVIRFLHKPFRRAQLLGSVLKVLDEPLAFSA